MAAAIVASLCVGPAPVEPAISAVPVAQHEEVRTSERRSYCSAVPAIPGRVLIFDSYEYDFGPGELSRGLVGSGYWPWENNGCVESGGHELRVVVFRKIPLAEVERHYPGEGPWEFRYVAYADALGYLDARIVELDGKADFTITEGHADGRHRLLGAAELRARLVATRARIVAALGER